MIHNEIKNNYHQKKRETAAAKKNKNENKEKLSNMGLFELSVHALMPDDVFRELKQRIELIQKTLEKCRNMYQFETVIFEVNNALKVVDGLLKSPQETGR